MQQRTTGIAKAALSFLALLVLTHRACAQNASKVDIPGYGDKYSVFVKQLEAGQTNINYTEFRQSFLESEQFRASSNQKPDLGALRKTMHELMKTSNYAEVIEVANKMLNIDYTDMEAHKVLRQAYKILGDDANAKKYHDIEFGERRREDLPSGLAGHPNRRGVLHSGHARRETCEANPG